MTSDILVIFSIIIQFVCFVIIIIDTTNIQKITNQIKHQNNELEKTIAFYRLNELKRVRDEIKESIGRK